MNWVYFNPSYQMIKFRSKQLKLNFSPEFWPIISLKSKRKKINFLSFHFPPLGWKPFSSENNFSSFTVPNSKKLKNQFLEKSFFIQLNTTLFFLFIQEVYEFNCPVAEGMCPVLCNILAQCIVLMVFLVEFDSHCSSKRNQFHHLVHLYLCTVLLLRLCFFQW